MQDWPNLVGVLEGLPWAVVGGVATRRYMPERATVDLDVAILLRDREKATARLRAAGYAKQGDLTIGGSSWRAPGGAAVDVIEGSEPWWDDALREAAANRDDEGTPTLTAPYLILMKLLASRLQDIADVSRMLGIMDQEGLGRVREIVRQLAPDLSEDLESLIVLGRLEQDG